MKLSVVIPVYRTAATLNRCVESVLSQEVDDMEVILVDDGSPDSSPQLCDAWAVKDQRIRVIHQQNGGLSKARNSGIEVATGDLITFVDSDDWLAPNTYPPLLDMMGDCDLLEYSIAGGLTLADSAYTDMDEYWLKTQAYAHTYACNKLYRTALFDAVRFPEGKVFEDAYTLPLLLRKAKRCVTTHLGHYHYTQNPEGITAQASGAQLAQLLNAHLTSGMPMSDPYYMYLVNIQMDVWEQTGATIQLPHRKVQAATLAGRQKAKAIVLNLFGIKILCRLNKAIHLFKKPSH